MATPCKVLDSSPKATEIPPVCCFDLDGTVLETDLLYESLISLSKQHPEQLLKVPLWLLQGLKILKARLAERIELATESLPYRQPILDLIAELRELGCRIVLATASHRKLAEAVAAHLGVFDEVVATDDTANLKGRTKAALLEERYGSHILYAGDSKADLHVWSGVRQAVVVGGEKLAARVAESCEVVRRIPVQHGGWKDYQKALRPHHWSKNVLLLLPLLLAHEHHAMAWLRSLFGVLLFSLAASGIYIFNDLLDLPSDRMHPWKRRRPLASGLIPIEHGLLMFIPLLLGPIVLGWASLGGMFSLALAAYCAVSIAYTISWKRQVLADVFVLTGFYGFRIITGAAINRTYLSHWFLIFAMFFFFSLAIAKRFSELMHAKELVNGSNSGRGYRLEDSQLLSMVGVASSFCAVIIFSLYCHAPEISGLYPHSGRLLLIAPLLLYWLLRMWLRAIRGELDEDPVALAMHDRVSYIVGLACAICIVLSVY
jgi:4-hydroxybenzoate polyprenyltransferase/phosphoserine phosphatase